MIFAGLFSDACMFREKLLFVDNGFLSMLTFAVLLLECFFFGFISGLLECYLLKLMAALVNDVTSIFFLGDFASL